jgi:hypothetical protein
MSYEGNPQRNYNVVPLPALTLGRHGTRAATEVAKSMKSPWRIRIYYILYG